MYNYTLSMIFGFIAMASAMASYFLKNKMHFMLFQTSAIVSLALSSLFVENYYAMVNFSISIIRIVTYQIIEHKGKTITIWLMSLFAVINIISFLCLNLKEFKPLDLMLLIGAVLYCFAFGIKNMKFLRLFFLVPTGISGAYFILVKATVFVIISYSFEFIANLVALIYYYIRENRTQEIKISKADKKA